MGRGTLGRRRGPSRTPSGPGEQLGPVLQAEWRQGGLAVVTQSPCWGEDCGVPAHWPSRRMLWEALRSWELRENAQWQVRCSPSLPPLSSVPTAPWRAELRERAFSAPAQPRASPGCRSPPPPSSGFSLAVFGSGGRPALPLSLRHHRLCGAGRGGTEPGPGGRARQESSSDPASRPLLQKPSNKGKRRTRQGGGRVLPGGAWAPEPGVAGGSALGAFVCVSRGRPSGPRPGWPGLPPAEGAAHSPPRRPDVAMETGKARARHSRGRLPRETEGRQAGPAVPRPPDRCAPARAAPPLPAAGPGGRDLDAPPRSRNQWALGQPGGRGGRGGGGDAETGAGGGREPTGRTDHGLQVPQVRQDRVLR